MIQNTFYLHKKEKHCEKNARPSELEPKTWPNIPYLWGNGRLGMKNWERFLLFHCIIGSLWLTLITRRCIFPYKLSVTDACTVYASQWKKTLVWMVPLRSVYASRHSKNRPLPWLQHGLDWNAVPEVGINSRKNLQIKIELTDTIQT